MKPIYAADAWFTRLMDEVGFLLQNKAGIPRFYLVPLLTLIALLAIYYRKAGNEPTVIDALFTVITFIGVLTIHFFEIHKRGRETPDMQVNIAVERVRNNPLYLAARVMSVFILAGVMVASLLAFPWRLPLAVIEYLFLWYPCMIYQHQLPPKRNWKSLFAGSGPSGRPGVDAANQDIPAQAGRAKTHNNGDRRKTRPRKLLTKAEPTTSPKRETRRRQI